VTGLPSLDHLEGEHYWEIKKFDGVLSRGFILRLVRVHTAELQRCVKNPNYRWWNFQPKHIDETYTKTSTGVVRRAWIGERDQEAYEMMVNRAKYDGETIYPSNFRTLDIDEDMIRQSAWEILKDLADEEHQNRFVGKYPPKVLG